jgi:hypothetical protein
MATLGSVLTNTRNGMSAREMAADHAMAMPSTTPDTAASTKAPSTSTVVTHRWPLQGMSLPGPMARSTAPGAGNRYSRMSRNETDSCHSAMNAANTPIAGR